MAVCAAAGRSGDRRARLHHAFRLGERVVLRLLDKNQARLTLERWV